MNRSIFLLANVSKDLYSYKSENGDYDAQLESLKEDLVTIRFVVQRVLTPIIVAFGVLGNLVNIVVLTRRWMKSSTNCYLTALAICDILYLVFALSMSFSHYPEIKSLPSYIHYRHSFGRPLTDTFSNTGVWLTLTFTIERYIGVCHPMKGMRWCTPQRARYIIGAVCIAAAIVTFPEFFEYKVLREVTDGNETIYRVRSTDLGQRPSYSFGYYFINQGLFTLIPFALLLIFNSLLIKAVYTAARQRRAMSKVVVVKCSGPSRPCGGGGVPHRQQSDQQKITVMLIVVVIVFLICQLPQAIQKLYHSYLRITLNSPTPELKSTQLKISANVLNLLVMINAASNFVLYSSFSTKFRRTFHRIFCHCLLGQRRSIPEILFTDMTSMNPSPPEESRAHLLRNIGQKGHYAHQWKSPQSSHGRGLRSGRTGSSPPNKNGYLEVVQGGKHKHNSSAL